MYAVVKIAGDALLIVFRVNYEYKDGVSEAIKSGARVAQEVVKYHHSSLPKACLAGL